jgi:hypothetical protein
MVNVFNWLRKAIASWLVGASQGTASPPPTPPGPGNASAGPIQFLDGSEIALEVLQAIGYRKVLKSATIISYNMQDYDFWGHGYLSHLLLRQLTLGASIQLFTTPPPGKPTNATFRSKYNLLATLDKSGVQILLNEKLHAKAYLFLDSTDQTTTIVGSANLTGPGFGMKLTPHDSLVELAMMSSHPPFLQDALTFVQTKIIGDTRTEDFATWFSRNSVEIGKAGL